MWHGFKILFFKWNVVDRNNEKCEYNDKIILNQF